MLYVLEELLWLLLSIQQLCSPGKQLLPLASEQREDLKLSEPRVEERRLAELEA